MPLTTVPRPLTKTQYDAGDAFVTRWQGACFTWNGRSRAEGTDCWGLVLAFARDVFELELPDWQRGDHSRGWVARFMAGEWHGRPRFRRPRDGRVVVAERAGLAHHVGIYWRGGVLHAVEGSGVIWQRLAEFAFLYPAHEFGELAL